MSEVTGKRCYVCGDVKPLSEFHRSSGARDGRQPKCKTCVRAYNATRPVRVDPNAAARAAAFRRNHPERERAAQAKWYEANREQKLANNAAWLEANLERKRAKDADWIAAHPESGLAANARARGALVVEQFTIEELREHLLDRGVDPDLCLYCKVAPREQWDHVMPLILGGPHAITNLAPACASCNARKNSALPDPAIAALLSGPPHSMKN